ncbi:unnamed protein product [Linum trigynum]|uniref:Glycine-rich protein n=1 Tax=Linum trigynum TaxID=586398 RepID=A0AAV2CL49_9ROSI
MAATPVPESADGPVLSLINKRLRALRKKYNRIIQMEESVAQGKALNNEQTETLRSKPSVSAAIDELEKLRQPLSVAVSEEIELAIERHRTESQPAAAAVVAAAVEEEKIGEAEGKEEEVEGSQPENFDAMVGDLLNLLYFGALFDVKSQNDFTATMLSRTHERGCCLTYDYVTDDATDLLSERDLDMISTLSGLLMSRPVDSSLSHKNALQRCVEHAKLWLANADCPVDSNADISYAGLRERLNKIMASDYFTTSPERKASMEVAAAAAAAGNYAHFQVPVHGVPIAVPVQVESHSVEYQPQHEDAAISQGQDVGDDQSNPTEEFQKDDPQFENPEEIVYGEQEETKPSQDFEHNNQQDTESREQQYGNRRNYQHQRGGSRGGGGGRRGYPNGRGGRGSGRGGGGYQNGRSSNQYYDQPGNYYPRNYHNNRGGRGGSRGGGNAGQPYNNDVGVAS